MKTSIYIKVCLLLMLVQSWNLLRAQSENDQVVLMIGSAIFQDTTVKIPVRVVSDGEIVSMDFRTKFNLDSLRYIDITDAADFFKVESQPPLGNFSWSDSTLYVTSLAHPEKGGIFNKNSVVFNLRFRNFGDNDLDSADFQPIGSIFGYEPQPVPPILASQLVVNDNKDDIFGCMNENACNFNEFATVDNGTCLIPEENCTVCNDEGSLDTLDFDGDGTCNKYDVTGCIDPAACNYNENAQVNDNSCIYVTNPQCQECKNGFVINKLVNNGCYACINNVYTKIDTDGDGICDGEEIEGCTDQDDCNYNSLATDHIQARCVGKPEQGCWKCNGKAREKIDKDGDGICDKDDLISHVDNSSLSSEIYPNPSSGSFTVLLNQKANLEMHDLTGKIILSIENIPANDRQLVKVPAHVFGVFLVKIFNESGAITKRMVIVNK